MGGDFAFPGMGFRDDGVHFFLGKFGNVRGIGKGKDAAGGHEFDDVGDAVAFSVK